MNNLLSSILVATDGSKDARLAIRAAVDLANGTGSELHVVHVWRLPPTAAYASTVENHSRVYERQAVEFLEEQVKLTKDGGGTVTAVHLREGRAPDEIAGLAQELDVDLLVLGSRGLGTIKRLVVGSVSEGVVHLAPSPTLVVRGGEGAWPPSRLVVGDDSSREAGRAGELAVSIGRLFDRRVLLVRVYPPQMYETARILNVDMTPKSLEEFDKALKERAAKLERLRGMRPEIKATVGYAAAVLQEFAEEGEGTALVAVGSRGLGAVRRFALGSTSTDVLRAVSGPVLVYPPTEAVL